MLADKVSQLERDVVTADRLARFWRKQIDVHGEAKATAFYTSLGLNHLESPKCTCPPDIPNWKFIRNIHVSPCGYVKSVEWEGLTLSREPSEVEKLCIKSISQAQDSGKQSISEVLLKARLVLIDSALTAIKKLTPATYHELILTMPEKLREELRSEVEAVFQTGRRLVARELAQQKSLDNYEVKQVDDSDLDNLADLTDSRIANDIQARIIAAAARFTLLGLTGKALWDAVSKEVGEGSTGWLDRAATGLANKVINLGREAEAEARSDEWERVEYSAILDQNVCSPCSLDDGQTATNEDELTPTPNPECEGGDWCRCFHVFITQ